MVEANDKAPERELTATVDLDKYLLHSKLEIVAELRAIMRNGTPVTVHFGGKDDFIVTTLLAVDGEAGAIVFDCGSQETANQRLAAAKRLTFAASLNRVRVQFTCGHAAATVFDGRPAFSASLPEALLRLQRREYYRVPAPALPALKCVVPATRAGQSVTLSLTVLDIGCGGIAVAANPDDPALENGGRYPCTVELPEMGTVQAIVAVRNTFEVTLPNGTKSRRCGYEFIDLPDSTQALIQRYLLQEQRRRKTRLA